MSKVRTEFDFSNQLDHNLTFRLRELSDLRRAIADAGELERTVLLKALVTLSYAHWEGFIKYSAEKYFEYVALRKYPFNKLHPSFYSNAFLLRLGAFSLSKPSIEERLKLVGEILNSQNNRFSYLPDELVNTGSNLNSNVMKNICLICDIPFKPFEERSTFIDVILLKRRNSIAHGEDALVGLGEVKDIIDNATELMRTFKNELENKIYLKNYLA